MSLEGDKVWVWRELGYEFGGSLGMSLQGDCHKVEVTPYLELLVTFGMSLGGVCHELYTQFYNKLTPNLKVTKIPWKKLIPN
jgi:hypothetical protein